MDKIMATIDETFSKLSCKSITDLKVILDICRKKGKTSVPWTQRADITEEVLINKIDAIFK